MNDLRAACIHGRYDHHTFYDPPNEPTSGAMNEVMSLCPGGRTVKIWQTNWLTEYGGIMVRGLPPGHYALVELAAIGDTDGVATGHPC